MRIVYYKLPSESGENVLVSLNPVYGECEVAVLIEKRDEGYPLFSLVLENGKYTADSLDDIEPYFVETETGFDSALPFPNIEAALAFGRNLQQAIDYVWSLGDE